MLPIVFFILHFSLNFYLHIPFCRQKCPYCKFALTPIFDAAKKRRYIAHLKSEIHEYFKKNGDENIDTLYFGGGTPSVLAIEEVADILSCFRRNKNTEVSFECNPEDITVEYIEGLLSLGINRLSLGVQSLNNETLKSMHRSDRESIFQALQKVESTLLSFGTPGRIQVPDILEPSYNSGGQRGISSGISLNIDFILGLPFSKSGETLESIKELHKTFPFITHTSVYMLEEGHYPREWQNESITEKEMEEEYEEICEYFDSIGWHHYEISNWSKPGYACQHNQGYWTHRPVRAFGLSGTSYVDGHRWTNASSFMSYYTEMYDEDESLSIEEIATEKLIYGIRTFSLLAESFDTNIIRELETLGYIQIEERKIILTPTGIFRENTIIRMLMGA